MLQPDEIQQLMEALKPMIADMISEAQPKIGPEDESMIEPDGDELPGMGGDLGAPPAPGAAGDLGAPPTTSPAASPAAGAPPVPGPGDEDDESMQYGKMLADEAHCYAKGGQVDEEALQGFVDTLDADDRRHYQAYAQASRDPATRALYAKAARLWGEGQGDDPAAAPATIPARGGEVQRYQRENAQLNRKLQEAQGYAKKLQQRNERLTRELAGAKQVARFSKRRETLTGLESEGFLIDVDAELAATNDFTDEQFDRHTQDTIPKNYQKANTMGPLDFGRTNPPKEPNQAGRRDKAAQYSKTARDYVQQVRESGGDADFKQVYDYVTAHDGQLPTHANGAAR